MEQISPNLQRAVLAGEDARFFQHCQELAQADPGECLFIDDMPANIAGAQTFGWNAIQYQAFPDFTQRMSDFGIDLSELSEPGA